MLPGNRGSKIFFSENILINLQGEKNYSSISGSRNSDFFTNHSELFMRNSSAVQVVSSNSSYSLEECKKIKLNGNGNRLIGNESSKVLLEGHDNTLAVENANEVVWSGSKGQSYLTNEGKPMVYGKDNQVLAKSNSKLLVVGHCNKIIAENNNDLKVRGHDNNVIALRTKNLTVDGNENQCYVKDVNMHHSLIRIPERSSCENQINFQGITIPSIVSEGLALISEEKQYTSSYKGVEMICPERVDDNLHLVQQYKEEVDFGKFIITNRMPQVKILYLDNACIIGKQYILGIFNFEVTRVCSPSGNASFKLRIICDELRPSSYDCVLSHLRDKVTITGKKGEMKQRLTISGNEITEQNPPSFNHKPTEFIIAY